MKQVYDGVIESISYYASLEKYDELFAIVSLLERHAIPQPIVEQLKGDLNYLFARKEEACGMYKKAAAIYEKNGEIKKSHALTTAITYIEKSHISYLK